jgi:hypothetical protein
LISLQENSTAGRHRINPPTGYDSRASSHQTARLVQMVASQMALQDGLSSPQPVTLPVHSAATRSSTGRLPPFPLRSSSRCRLAPPPSTLPPHGLATTFSARNGRALRKSAQRRQFRLRWTVDRRTFLSVMFCGGLTKNERQVLGFLQANGRPHTRGPATAVLGLAFQGLTRELGVVAGWWAE